MARKRQGADPFYLWRSRHFPVKIYVVAYDVLCIIREREVAGRLTINEVLVDDVVNSKGAAIDWLRWLVKLMEQ